MKERLLDALISIKKVRLMVEDLLYENDDKCLLTTYENLKIAQLELENLINDF